MLGLSSLAACALFVAACGPRTPPEGAVAPSEPPAADSATAVPDTAAAATPLQLFEVEAGDAEEWPSGRRVFFMMAERVLTLPGDGRYEILDVRGRIGEAEILPDRIRGYGRTEAAPWHVELSWIEPPARDVRDVPHLVGIGPLSSSLPRARLLLASLARAGLTADAPHEAESGRVPADLPVRYAVDLDGDNIADLLSSYESTREPDDSTPWLRYHVSAKTLLRVEGSWREVEACEWTEEELVGP